MRWLNVWNLTDVATYFLQVEIVSYCYSIISFSNLLQSSFSATFRKLFCNIVFFRKLCRYLLPPGATSKQSMPVILFFNPR